ARAVEFDGVLQSLHYGLLTDHFAKNLGAELPSYDLVFHRWVRHGGYCVTLDDLLPLLPSGPGGVCGVQLHSPPLPDKRIVSPDVESSRKRNREFGSSRDVDRIRSRKQDTFQIVIARIRSTSFE